MSGFFQRLFGKDNKPAIARGPLGLHLNSGFTLDTLAFRLLEDALLIALPGEEYTVAAVSCIDLGGGSQIFRYYTSGDEFLQINTTGGEDIDDIDDIKLFVYEESYGISKESHWREAINAKVMGAMTLNWQEKRWQRFFNSEEPGNIEPVYMLEKVDFAGVRLYMPALSEKIINHNTAAGMFMGTAALAGGIFNAACMTW
ncbi:DUF2491 family protein [Escherichia coli]|nr:DUF2491 family protein [Escherichia coli]HAK9484269.1 DUF2491 family protein [Escherichia coli]